MIEKRIVECIALKFTTAQKSGNVLKIAFLPLKTVVVYEFSCRCEARYVGRTTQRLAGRIKQYVPKSIRKKSNTVREQPLRIKMLLSMSKECCRFFVLW